MGLSGGIRMEYGIRELAEMAGVTARTLRWYDSVGLLKPARVGENGYRYYSGAEVDRLQHILFYRELGVELEQIRRMLDDPSFDRMTALRGHLAALEEKRGQIDAMIDSVRNTIKAEERNEIMKDREKFKAFKKNAVQKNEEKYGREAREKYGNEAVDASNRMMMNMKPEDHAEWTRIGDEILSRLEVAVSAEEDPAGPEGRAIAELHKKWLCFVWEKYTTQAHIGVANMYVCDERFTQYYDRNIPGCAAFLRDAVTAMLR